MSKFDEKDFTPEELPFAKRIQDCVDNKMTKNPAKKLIIRNISKQLAAQLGKMAKALDMTPEDLECIVEIGLCNANLLLLQMKEKGCDGDCEHCTGDTKARVHGGGDMPEILKKMMGDTLGKATKKDDGARKRLREMLEEDDGEGKTLN